MYEIVDNFRPVQELHGRRVLRNQMASDETKPPHTAATTKPSQDGTSGTTSEPKTSHAKPQTPFSMFLILFSMLATTIIVI